MPSVPTVAEIKSKGFDKAYWQKYRDSRLSKMGIGKCIIAVRKVAGKDGLVLPKFVLNGQDLVKVLAIYSNLYNALKGAKDKAVKLKKSDSEKFCLNFMQAVKDRQEDAREICYQAQNSAVDAQKNEEIKQANELKKTMVQHLNTLKDTLKEAVNTQKVSAANLKIVNDLMKKNPPTPQEIAMARKGVINLNACGKQWAAIGKNAAKFAPTWNLKKFPEHSKQILANVAKTLDTTHGAILKMLQGKISADVIAKAAENVCKAEARMYAAAVKGQGEKASKMLIAMKKLDDGIEDSMASLRASAADKKSNPQFTYANAETMMTNLDVGLKKLAERANELKQMKMDEESKKWPKDATKYFTPETKLHIKSITAAKMTLPNTKKNYVSAKAETQKILKVVARQMEGA